MILRLLLTALFLGVLHGHAQPASADRTAIAVEALSRLDPGAVQKSHALLQAVQRVIDATRGTANYAMLVRKFDLTNEAPGMVQFAVDHPADESGVAAMGWLLGIGRARLLEDTLQSTNTVLATRAAEALGNTGDQRAVPILSPLIRAPANPNKPTTPSSPANPPALAVRKQAVRALARTAEGARAILEAARSGALPEELHLVAGMELAAVRWEEIRTAAAAVLPPPQGGDAQPLPPLAQLLSMKGDPARGAAVFVREGPNCSTCHRVGGQGTEVGPDLSGIGTKLGRDALFDAILDPSAGISFGYEAIELRLKSGDEAFGLIVSETGEEVAVRDTRGVVTRHRKADIESRRQMTLSIMPSGLHMTMTTQELVDLVAYLEGLKPVQ